MSEEINALLTNSTQILIPKPYNANIVGSKWIYKIKRHSDGSIERYKARLVAQGFTQQSERDYKDTFSPVIKATTIRTILAITTKKSWPIHQLDVSNAFLHGNLSENIFMAQPPGFVDTSHLDYVFQLQKSLYGLK